MSAIRPELARLTATGGQFEVVVDEVDGHPIRTFANRLRHMSEFIRLGEAHGTTPFLIQQDRRLGHGEAMRLARRLASGLADRFGVGPGDRVGIVGANHVDWVVSYWAAVALDTVVVPLNAWWTAAELGDALDDSGCRVVVSDSRRAAAMAGTSFPADRLVTWGHTEGLLDLGDILGSEIDLPGEGRRGEDEPALIFYTSGTTGRSKGVVLSHRNVVSGFLNAVAMTTAAAMASPPAGPTERQVDLCVVPLFHATANLAIMVPFVAAGHTLVFMPPGRFDPEVAGEVIERERVTRFGGVPTIVTRIVDSGVWRRRDLSSIRRVSFGGAPPPPDLRERVAGAFPDLADSMIHGYGLTETTAVSALNIGEDYAARPASVGIPVPTAEIRIVGPGASDMPAGEPGEILIRGGHVTRGYWNRPEETAEAFVDGFFRTGDIGFFDGDGFLHVTGRSKDLVIRGGENVGAAEVEAALLSHPAVADAAVIGVPHRDLGEEVKAVVVVTDGYSVTEDELRSHLSGRLAAFKVPSIWDLSARALPRSPSGKLLKRVLRDEGAPVFVEDDSPL